MKIASFLTITYPEARGDLYKECVESALGFSDELIIVDGGAAELIDSSELSFRQLAQSVPVTSPGGDRSLQWISSLRDPRIRIISRLWPREFSWTLIGESFQFGYEQAEADWIFHLDSDFITHEKSHSAIREACERNSDAPALTFLKWQFILPDRFNLKSRLVIAVNKGKYGDKIRFNSGGDLAQPAFEGKYIEPGTVPDIKIPIWNYEKLLKTEAQIKDDVGRMARAWQRHFGEYYLGGSDDDSAYQEWLKMQLGRFKKPQQHLELTDHPIYIRDTIKNLSPENWGYSGFSYLGLNDYVNS